jgi:hypothetical protein
VEATRFQVGDRLYDIKNDAWARVVDASEDQVRIQFDYCFAAWMPRVTAEKRFRTEKKCASKIFEPQPGKMIALPDGYQILQVKTSRYVWDLGQEISAKPFWETSSACFGAFSSSTPFGVVDLEHGKIVRGWIVGEWYEASLKTVSLTYDIDLLGRYASHVCRLREYWSESLYAQNFLAASFFNEANDASAWLRLVEDATTHFLEPPRVTLCQ